MDGEVYYTLKTSNQLSDIQYKSLDEVMAVYTQLTKEEQAITQVIETIVFQRALELEDAFSEGLMKPDDIYRYNEDIRYALKYCINNYSECIQDEAKQESIYQNYEDELGLMRDSFTKLAKYTVELEEMSLWETLKNKILNKKRPALDLGVSLDKFGKN